MEMIHDDRRKQDMCEELRLKSHHNATMQGCPLLNLVPSWLRLCCVICSPYGLLCSETCAIEFFCLKYRIMQRPVHDSAVRVPIDIFSLEMSVGEIEGGTKTAMAEFDI